MFSFDVNVSARYSQKTQAEKVEFVSNVAQKTTTLQSDKIALASL